MYSWWNDNMQWWGNVGDTNVWIWGEEEDENGMQPCSVKGKNSKTQDKTFSTNYQTIIWLVSDKDRTLSPKQRLNHATKHRNTSFLTKTFRVTIVSFENIPL